MASGWPGKGHGTLLKKSFSEWSVVQNRSQPSINVDQRREAWVVPAILGSTVGTVNDASSGNHGPLGWRLSKYQPTDGEKYHEERQSSPRFVAVGYGNAKKASPRPYPQAQIRLPSPRFLPRDSHLPSEALMTRMSANLGELLEQGAASLRDSVDRRQPL
jgi:hypothetical protein